MTPEQLGKRMVEATDIRAGSVEEAAKIFMKILNGEAHGHRMRSYWQMPRWHYIAQVVIKVMMRHIMQQWKVGSGRARGALKLIALQ